MRYDQFFSPCSHESLKFDRRTLCMTGFWDFEEVDSGQIHLEPKPLFGFFCERIRPIPFFNSLIEIQVLEFVSKVRLVKAKISGK